MSKRVSTQDFFKDCPISTYSVKRTHDYVYFYPTQAENELAAFIRRRKQQFGL